MPQKHWNKIPSIIPTLSDETAPNSDPGDVSDQGDDNLQGSPTEQPSKDVEAELLNNFVDILAYS